MSRHALATAGLHAIQSGIWLACLASGGIGGTIGRRLGGEMTIATLIEAVIIVVVIYFAVRFFMKRG